MYSSIIYLYSAATVFAAIDVDHKSSVKTVSYEHVINWSIGLVIVLCLLFSCLWLMRKMGALPVNPKENMKVLAGLSLGMREKLILVQLGEKQLVLGVTPGKIEKLLVLEGNDRLFQETPDKQLNGDFSHKLKQLMTGSTCE